MRRVKVYKNERIHVPSFYPTSQATSSPTEINRIRKEKDENNAYEFIYMKLWEHIRNQMEKENKCALHRAAHLSQHDWSLATRGYVGKRHCVLETLPMIEKSGNNICEI